MSKFINLFLSLIIKFSAVVISLFINRWRNSNLSSQELADYNLIITISSLTLIALGFGINNVIQRYCTNLDPIVDKNKLISIWTTLNLFRIFTYFLGLTILFIFSITYNLKDLLTLFIIFTAQFLILLDFNFKAVSDARGKTLFFSITDVLSKIFIICILMIQSTDSITNKLQFLALILFFSYLVMNILDYFYNSRFIQFDLKLVNLAIIKENSFLAIAFSTIITSIYLTSDRLILRYYVNNIQYNGYVNAYTLFEVVGIGAGVTVPLISSIIKKRINANIDKSTKMESFNKIIKIYLVYSFMAAILFYIFSPIIIKFIDVDNKYYESFKVAIPILSISVFFSYFNSLISYLYFLFGKEKVELKIQMINLIITMLSYYILISNYGVVGASIATLIMYLTDFTLRLLYFKFRFLKIIESS